MNSKSYIRTEVPEQTVIFRHKAACFKLHNSIRYDAVYIKEPDLSDKDYALTYYRNELKRVEKSGKSFIVINYNPLVGELFSTLLSKPRILDYKNWVFFAFFHEDPETLSLKSRKIPDIIKEKVSVMADMMVIPCIKKCTVPLNFVVSFRYLLPMLLEEWGFCKNKSEFLPINPASISKNHI